MLALIAGLPFLCTLHANSAREALVKVSTLPLGGGRTLVVLLAARCEVCVASPGLSKDPRTACLPRYVR